MPAKKSKSSTRSSAKKSLKKTAKKSATKSAKKIAKKPTATTSAARLAKKKVATPAAGKLTKKLAKKGAKNVAKKSAAKPVAKKSAAKKSTGGLKLISWNVNGLRAVLGKGDFVDFLNIHQPDVLCLQEIKAQADQVELDFPEYEIHWNSAEKKGYSGTLIMTRRPALSVRRGLDAPENEGRALTCEYDDFFLVNVYTPNAAENLKRLDFRMDWDRKFLKYIKNLEKKKPVIFCGDTNVAHKEIDLKNPKANRKNPGFTDEERAGFTAYIDAGLIDTFREFNQEPEQYSWWSYRFNSRAKNIGWRLDYFLISAGLRPCLKDAFILQDVMGSDHCPVGILLDK